MTDGEKANLSEYLSELLLGQLCRVECLGAVIMCHINVSFNCQLPVHFFLSLVDFTGSL